MVLKDHLNSPIYKPTQSKKDQKTLQNLRKSVDNYSSSSFLREKKYVFETIRFKKQTHCSSCLTQALSSVIEKGVESAVPRLTTHKKNE